MDLNPKIANRIPLVSIIMLTYNRANYIGEAIKSVFAQTYQNWELIILDDGSTDNTAEIVAGFADPRLRYIKDRVNKGLFTRRCESLTYAQGKYIAILDSDDIWIQTDKLERQVNFLEAEETYALVGTAITVINKDGLEIAKNTYHTSDSKIRKNILRRNQFANSSVLIRNAMLKKTAGYRSFAMAEDLELFLQLGQVGKFANLKEYTTAYRVHGGNISLSKLKLIPYILAVIKLHKHTYPGYCSAWLKFTLYKLFLVLKQATLQ
jgi:glycosyltransferase involved in cell wall biosynthesis